MAEQTQDEDTDHIESNTVIPFNSTETELLSEIYERIVTSGGPLDRIHFDSIAAILYDEMTHPDSVELLFHMFDRDNNGIIDEDEWIDGLELTFRAESDQIKELINNLAEETSYNNPPLVSNALVRFVEPLESSQGSEKSPSTISLKKWDEMKQVEERLQKLAIKRMTEVIADRKLLSRLWDVVRDDPQLLKAWSQLRFPTAKLISVTKTIADIKGKGHIPSQSLYPPNRNPVQAKSTPNSKPLSFSNPIAMKSVWSKSLPSPSPKSVPLASSKRSTKSQAVKAPPRINSNSQFQTPADNLGNFSLRSASSKAGWSLQKKLLLQKAYGVSLWPHQPSRRWLSS